MSKRLNIALTADPELPVPPELYGGIERMIDMLISGLVEKGHQVTLFAHSDSVTAAKLLCYPGKSSTALSDTLKNTWLINKTLFNNKFDIVHSFGRLAYLLPQLPALLPKLMSYQREPTIGQIKTAARFASKNTLAFTGCSNYISRQIEPFAQSFTVYNGVDTGFYSCKEVVDDDAPLVFLGRIEPIKGAHTAIETANKTQKKLIIAGNVPAGNELYFKEKIQPYLNEHIQYIGPVNDQQKNKLLGSASALLMPIEWNEPFGIVMAEAMACGTPVIGFNRGAVKEVVDHGRNGFSCDTPEEMISLVSRIPEIDRSMVRKITETRFSSTAIIEAYLALYYQVIQNCESRR